MACMRAVAADAPGHGLLDPRKPPPWVSSDFSLLPEIASLTHRINTTWRISLQLRRYRHFPTFGIIENKLLSHTLLKALRMTPIGVSYGGFWSQPLGMWPSYRRHDLLAALRNEPSRNFVLKAATNGGGVGVLVMSGERWLRERWTEDRVADFAEQLLANPSISAWGQIYEHRGIILQRRLHGSDTLGFELRFHVAWGHIHSGFISPLPGYPGADPQLLDFIRSVGKRGIPLAFSQHNGVAVGAPRCDPELFAGVTQQKRELLSNACARYTERTTNGTMHHVRRMARVLRDTLGADWFRLDVLPRAGGELPIVNEISYPSHDLAEPQESEPYAGSLALLTHIYHERGSNGLRVIPALNLVTCLLQLAGIQGDDGRAAFRNSDGRRLPRLAEAEYQASLMPPRSVKWF